MSTPSPTSAQRTEPVSASTALDLWRVRIVLDDDGYPIGYDTPGDSDILVKADTDGYPVGDDSISSTTVRLAGSTGGVAAYGGGL